LQKAAVRHALEMDHTDRSAQGKLALVKRYVSLMRANSGQPEQRRTFVDAAQANFAEAVTSSRSADPHLGWLGSMFTT
jgi:hypothetical protein